MPPANDYTSRALEYIRHLSVTLGGRGSCTPAEREAAEYVADQMRALGAKAVQIEPYQGAPSTYRPYALALAAAMLGTVGVWLVGGWQAVAVAAILNALGAWGMLAETDFAGNWMRWLLPRAGSQNSVGVVRPTGPVRRRVVLCAHLDTHRTPVFYSSEAWHMLFGFLVAGAFVSMVAAALLYGLGAILGWEGVRWIGLLAALVQAFALSLCLHADFTPFSPGANDNASGTGVILGLVERLGAEPLSQTEVWLAFTGCEEVSAYGIASFLDTHAAGLGDNAVYVILDQVGLGRLMYLTSDGLILKRKTHPLALQLAQRADSALPELEVGEQVGIAYTDAAVATKRGLIALTIDALPPPNAMEAMHWHQMSDTVDHIDPQSLADAHAFTWQVLQEVDRL
jgi:hypothetical protein